MLRLQTKPAATLIGYSAFALDGSVEKIAAIKLDSRLIGENAQHAPRVWVVHLRRLRQSSSFGVEHPVMIVPSTEMELLIVRVDAAPDSCRFSEVERRGFH